MAVPPREPGSPTRQSLPAWIRVTSLPSCPLHSPRKCLFQKSTSSGQSDMLVKVFLVGIFFSKRKSMSCRKKTHFFPLMLACPLCANGFFLPKVLFSSAISVFPHEKWWSVVSCWAEVMRSLSSQVPAVISRWTGPWREVDLSRMLTLTPVLSLHLQCPQYQRYRNKKRHSGHAKVNET